MQAKKATTNEANHRRTGVVGRGVAGHHIDARADDAADAQQHQVPRPQGALQLVGIGLVLDLFDRFLEKQSVPAFRGICGHVVTLPQWPTTPVGAAYRSATLAAKPSRATAYGDEGLWTH